MLVPICEIGINPGWRKVGADEISALAKSITEVGLLNPITITPDHTLITENHCLEAAKLLGGTEIAGMALFLKTHEIAGRLHDDPAAGGG